MPCTRVGHGTPNVLQGRIWASVLATVLRCSRQGFLDLAVKLNFLTTDCIEEFMTLRSSRDDSTMRFTGSATSQDWPRYGEKSLLPERIQRGGRPHYGEHRSQRREPFRCRTRACTGCSGAEAFSELPHRVGSSSPTCRRTVEGLRQDGVDIASIAFVIAMASATV
jgi:hypothetical protein